MSIVAKTVDLKLDNDQPTRAVFEVRAPSGSPECPTTIESDLELLVGADGSVWNGSLVFSELKAASIDEAIDTLARWCDDTAKELRKVKPTQSIPVVFK